MPRFAQKKPSGVGIPSPKSGIPVNRIVPPSFLQNKAAKGGGPLLPNFKVPVKKHPITELREKSIAKDKWNLYVGDKRYKTNMFL
jgi:hypothetical protein